MLWTGFLAISLQRLWFYPARNPIEQEGYGFEGSFHSLSFLSFLFCLQIQPRQPVYKLLSSSSWRKNPYKSQLQQKVIL